MLVESIVALLGQLHSQGQTVVLVTHDVEVASQAGRVIRMRDGKLMGQLTNQVGTLAGWQREAALLRHRGLEMPLASQAAKERRLSGQQRLHRMDVGAT